MPKLQSITKSTNPNKKLMAIFLQGSGRKKTIHFGAAGYSDFTLSGNESQRAKYIARHNKEDWNDPMTAGALSRFILWGNSTNREKNIADFKKRFNV
jgi:hypothetical protein